MSIDVTRADPHYARALDAADALAELADAFHHPRDAEGRRLRYFCGHSLGLQPRGAAAAVARELRRWAERAVLGHFEAPGAWSTAHAPLAAPLARLVGARPDEVVAMNTLTVNLHLMLASFYQPLGLRQAVVIEGGAFPSDHHAVSSHLTTRGQDPTRQLLVWEPDGDGLLDEGALEALLARRVGEVALVVVSGVQFATGQVLDMQRLARAAHDAGALLGLDLAHAVGNVPLALHDWGVDFAVWCSYKYLNAGPGAIAGCFVHARHSARADLPRLAGWWGHDPATRFEMRPAFTAAPGADGWQLSNPSILSLAPLRASLELFERVSLDALHEKQRRLTAYLRALLTTSRHAHRLVTPAEAGRHGSQVSVRVPGDARALSAHLEARGVICDARPPDLLRLAPVPLYTRFDDVWTLVNALDQALDAA